jgi:predicted permease
MMAVGVYAKKKGYINKEINGGLSNILLNICFPLLIISSFNIDFNREMLNNSVKIFLFTVLISVILIILGIMFFHRINERQAVVLKFGLVFSNCSFMGYPILAQVIGSKGIFYGSIFTMVFNLFAFTYGVMLFTGEKDIKGLRKALINPNIFAVIIGFAVFIFSIKIPFPISKSMALVGSMTTPLSMLILGAMIAEMNIKEVFAGYKVYYALIARLIVAPIITLVVLRLFGASDIVIKVIVIAEAMPFASNTAVFAGQYNGDKSLASRCVFITTAFSILTIPFVISLI